MQHLIWLVSRLRLYKLLIALSLLGSLFESLGTSGVSLLMKDLVDKGFLNRDMTKLTQSVVLILFLALLSQVGNFLVSYFTNMYAEKDVLKLRETLYYKVLYSGRSFLMGMRSADLTARILSDLELYKTILRDHVPRLFRDPLTAIFLVGVLLYRDYLLTLTLLAVLPVLALAIQYFGKKKAKYTKRLQEDLEDLTQKIYDAFHGYENVKVFSAEEKFLGWLKEISLNAYTRAMKKVFYTTLNSVFDYMLGYAVVALVLLYGGHRIVEGSLTTGEFISYITALVMLQLPLMETQKGIMEIRAHLPVIDRIKQLLNLPKEEDGHVEFKGLSEGIRVSSLSVGQVLKDVSFHVKKGQRVGIVGHTGSGKSTLLRALAGLVEYKGSILYDSVELRDFRRDTFFRRIGFLTQEPFIFEGTVRDNLLIAKPDATQEELKKALELSLLNLPLDHHIKEGGKNLSGGERQRLAMARIFLKDPEIVLLDEATSSLDVNTEKKLMENLYSYFKDRTILMVAHRLTTLKDCDVVLLLEDGMLVKEGSYEEVISTFLQRP
ncbi:ABC transporter ATP-binding protein [Thermocrinis minervae]|uniref:ATP-binding cassette, subfamily C/ATP-binding cassette, subfamily B, MsbA n=1 Tax=Thermocrinis minervae TaxID=381751 RepID=A0A1M6QAP1_9AQUI|nr:ABC transporter ATP-binding protein [Thermocrinis minervae]SHK17339.1 ATP-binding cassette, subfamily C/ATP-binding cassette, subfamily B, MsbA [Thermocrinis minervae]